MNRPAEIEQVYLHTVPALPAPETSQNKKFLVFGWWLACNDLPGDHYMQAPIPKTKSVLLLLLILFAIDVYKSALSLIACVPTVKVLVTPLFHRDTEAGVAREFMFCKW